MAATFVGGADGGADGDESKAVPEPKPLAHNIQIPEDLESGGTDALRIAVRSANADGDFGRFGWEAIHILVFLMSAPLLVQVAIMKLLTQLKNGHLVLAQIMCSVPVQVHENKDDPTKFAFARAVFKRNQKRTAEFMRTWWLSGLWERRLLVWNNPVAFAMDCRDLFGSGNQFDMLPKFALRYVTSFLDSRDIDLLLDNCQKSILGISVYNEAVKRQFNMRLDMIVDVETRVYRDIYVGMSEFEMVRIAEIDLLHVVRALNKILIRKKETVFVSASFVVSFLMGLINVTKMTRTQLCDFFAVDIVQDIFVHCLENSSGGTIPEHDLCNFHAAYGMFLQLFRDKDTYSWHVMALETLLGSFVRCEYDIIRTTYREIVDRIKNAECEKKSLVAQMNSDTTYIQELNILEQRIRASKSEGVVRASANNFYVRGHMKKRFGCHCWKCLVYWSVNSFFSVEENCIRDTMTRRALLRRINSIYKDLTQLDCYRDYQWNAKEMCYVLNTDLGMVKDPWGIWEKPKGGAACGSTCESVFGMRRPRKPQQSLEVARCVEKTTQERRQKKAAERKIELEKSKKRKACVAAAETEALYRGACGGAGGPSAASGSKKARRARRATSGSRGKPYKGKTGRR